MSGEFRSGFQGGSDKRVEEFFAFVRGEVFFGVGERIAHGVYTQSLFSESCGVAVECGGFHFHAEHAHFSPFELSVSVVVKIFGAEDVTDFVVHAAFCRWFSAMNFALIGSPGMQNIHCLMH